MFKGDRNFDDDGQKKRTGTWLNASAHIITAVLGSGVLSLPWAIAQLGWLVGPALILAFSCTTYFTSTLLSVCYRSGHPVYGKRNYTYSETVQAILGRKYQLCGIIQYIHLVGVAIGYTITASISMLAVKRSNCVYKNDKCNIATYTFIIIFACIQIVLSQISSFSKLSWLSIVAAVMSFAYCSIGIGLSIAKIAGGGHVQISLTGLDVSGSEKVWRTFQAIGDIAFAYAFSNVLIEIQDTLKSSPSVSENKVMKRASFYGILTTTMLYMLFGILGYAAFGNDAPRNFFTGFGSYESFWLIDFANICLAVHLIGAYQVFCQPIFGFVEKCIKAKWYHSKFINEEHALSIPLCGTFYLNFFRVVWRTTYVIITALIAMMFPHFNDFLGLIGSLSFWPLTVYFPIELYIKQSNMEIYSFNWTWLKILSWASLIISIISAAGSISGLSERH